MAKAKPSYSKERCENIQAIIAELKVRNKLTDADIAKALGRPLSTFQTRKAHPGDFRLWEIWAIMQMTDTPEEKKAGIV